MGLIIVGLFIIAGWESKGVPFEHNSYSISLIGLLNGLKMFEIRESI